MNKISLPLFTAAVMAISFASATVAGTLAAFSGDGSREVETASRVEP